MKIAITGGTGLVGRALLEVFHKEHPDWEVTALSRKPLPPNVKYNWMPLDVVDTAATYKTITRLNPDVVIHAAAMAKPEACEKDNEGAMRTNFLGTRNVALACMRFDAEMLHISTDQVFYGAGDKMHGEYDEPRATNFYGHTKILAEKYVREHLQRWWIVRMGKIFGGPGDSASFLNHAYETLTQNRPLRVVEEWAAHMTHSIHFSQAVAKLLTRKTYGIYHIAHPAVPSYKDAAEFLADALGTPKKLLMKVTQKDLGLPVTRAAHLELSTNLWRLDFGEDIPSWQDSIKLLIKERR